MTAFAYVKELVVDRWDGIYCENSKTPNPGLEDVVAAVRALDACTATMVALYGDEEAHLAIGGGGGRYVVYVTDDNEVFLNLINEASEDEGVVLLFVGGQEGEYPSRMVVGLEAAVNAATDYVETGRPAAGLRWEEQN
ncbi:hypothetical protein JYT84_00975 [bacterium AH-315-M10]|nr:hypothetical protein [bacterium AH-315-M10]